VNQTLSLVSSLPNGNAAEGFAGTMTPDGRYIAFVSAAPLDPSVADQNLERDVFVRDLVTGELEKHFGHAVVLASGGYGNVFYLSTNAMGCNTTAIWKAYKKGALFGNPCYTQIHPTCLPQHGDYQSKLARHNAELRSFCHQSGIHYSLYVTDRDLGDFVFATLPAIGLFK
jgi:hypothetical protein